MFQKKRQLKKDKSKNRVKFIIKILIFFVIIFSAAVAIYLYLSSGKTSYLNPVVQSNVSHNSVLESLLRKNNIDYTNISMNRDGSTTVNLNGGGEVILSSKKDIGSQITSLQLILSRLTIEGKKLKTLDFRFDNPVVSF